MREAGFYVGGDGFVSCFLCPHNCEINDGFRGVCGVRENRGGILESLVYGVAAATHVDPIEKKPLFHFKPGSSSYSVSTVGCNLTCGFCQNWDISQGAKGGGEIAGRDFSPEDIVSDAVKVSCDNISYTYTEPTVFFEYAYDIGVLARSHGLGNVFVSNGFTGEQARLKTSDFLDAANIDLKSMSDGFYKRLCGGRLDPVLDSLRYYVKAGVWVEVTTLVIPGENDSDEELKDIASFIIGELGDSVPWHVSRFHPDYKLTGVEATPIETVRMARDIGLKAGLKHVYAGNIPHEEGENTFCPGCGAEVVTRIGFGVSEVKLKEGKCIDCGEHIRGVWH